MSAQAVVLEREVESILNVVERRTAAFMRDELSLSVQTVERKMHHEETVILRGLTAIVGVGSSAGLYIAYSYDDSLLREMTKVYAAELSIGPDEEALYMRETASDIVNVIVGNCTADLARRGEIMTLSPPVLAPGARTIQGRPKTAAALLTLSFAPGALDVAFVGPKLLFDEQLNYKEGGQ